MVDIEKLKTDIVENFTSLDDWYKYGALNSWRFFGADSIDKGISHLTCGLGRAYCGESFFPTGKSKTNKSYEQYAGIGFEDTIETVYVTYYEYQSKTRSIWEAVSLPVLVVPSEKEVLKKIQSEIYCYCLKEQIDWQEFIVMLDKRKKLNKEIKEKDEAAKRAALAAIPEPEWFTNEIWRQSLRRVHVGSKTYNFFWSPKEGTVIQECCENGKKSITALGKDREYVVSYIKGLHRQYVSLCEKHKEYEQYKAAQLAKKGLVKSFEKWLK